MTIRNLGFGARLEDVNAVEAWLGTLPADGYRNVRRSYIHTQNLCDLIPTTSVWPGLAENPSPLMPPHSPPLVDAMIPDVDQVVDAVMRLAEGGKVP